MPLLPAGGERDPAVLFDRAAGFRNQTGAVPFVLMVDDLHLLDVTSTVLLGQLLDAGVVVLLGTLRAGEPVSDMVSGWWRSERMVRIDLADLTAEGLDTLLHMALGGRH